MRDGPRQWRVMMGDESSGDGERELATFAAKVSAFRETLAPSEQRLLDGLLLAAIEERGEVEGYGFDRMMAKQAALAAVMVLGLAAGTIGAPLASPAHAADLAQPLADNMPTGSTRATGPTTSTTPAGSRGPMGPTTSTTSVGPGGPMGSAGPTSFTTPPGPGGPLGSYPPTGATTPPIPWDPF